MQLYIRVTSFVLLLSSLNPPSAAPANHIWCSSIDSAERMQSMREHLAGRRRRKNAHSLSSAPPSDWRLRWRQWARALDSVADSDRFPRCLRELCSVGGRGPQRGLLRRQKIDPYNDFGEERCTGLSPIFSRQVYGWTHRRTKLIYPTPRSWNTFPVPNSPGSV